MTGTVHVDIRAVAALSCFGADRNAHVSALREGRSGLELGAVKAAWGKGIRAAVIPGEASSPQLPFTLTDRIASQLVDGAGLTADDCKALGVFVGTTTGIAASEELAYFELAGLSQDERWKLLSGGAGRLTAHLARRLGAEGPAFTYVTACTSTAVALLMAMHALRSGVIPRAVVFGIDVLMGISLSGFRLLKLYSPTVCRPFDRAHDGLQMGEAAAGLVLEARTDPRPRSRFEVLDGAIAHDPGHIAAGSSDGMTASRVMARALERARVAPSAVSAIKAHGTGTQVNDLAELQGLKRTFGDHVPPFASLKGAFGHTLGASTALELSVWTWALEEGFIPGSVGYQTPVDGASLVPQARPLPTDGNGGTYMFNSFGFGGTSASFLVADHGA